MAGLSAPTHTQVMERQLRHHLLKNLDAKARKTLLSRVDELTGTITIHGDYKEPIVTWLLSLGF